MKINKPQWARAKDVRSRCARDWRKSHFISIHTRGGEFAIIGEGEDLIKNSSQARARERSRNGRNRPEGQEGIGEKGLRRQSIRGGRNEEAKAQEKENDVFLRARNIE